VETYGEIETKRLLLRVPRLEDAPRVFEAYARDPAVTRFLRWKPHESPEDAEAAMQARLQRLGSGAELSWLPCLRGSRELIGSISLTPGPRAEAELGYAFGHAFWGRGYATEACESVLRWSLKEGGFSRIHASCDVDNLASLRVLEKLGMQRERLAKDFTVHPNLSPKPRDCWIFSRIAAPH